MVRERSAPFYIGRELPQRVISTAAGGASSVSGMETLIRACSTDVEVATGTKTFTLAGLTASAGSTTPGFTKTNGTGSSYCAAAKTVATTVALTTGFTAGVSGFTGCNSSLSGTTLGATVTAGTWDGTKSGATISSTGSFTGGIFHVAHSDIVETTF